MVNIPMCYSNPTIVNIYIQVAQVLSTWMSHLVQFASFSTFTSNLTDFAGTHVVGGTMWLGQSFVKLWT